MKRFTFSIQAVDKLFFMHYNAPKTEEERRLPHENYHDDANVHDDVRGFPALLLLRRLIWF